MARKQTGPSVEELLSAAIVAAKGRQPDEARALLRRVLAADPTNVDAWLWMSGVIGDPLKREACLQKVVELEPDHPVARRGLARARKAAAEQLLAQGIRASQAGRQVQAHKLLTDVVMRDEQNLEAWIWLSRVVESPEDREVCYENVLTLDPDNEEAQVGLALIQESRKTTAEANFELIEGEPEADAREASTLAGDVLGEDYRERHTIVEPEPEPEPTSPAQAIWERYEDLHRCPYCAAPTQPEAERCPACGHPLWVRIRVRAERSSLLWILITLQMAATGVSAALPFIAALLAGYQTGIEDTGQLFAAYLGLSHTLPAAALADAYAVLAPLVFWLLWAPALFGLVVTIGLFLRWPIIFYGMLASALVGLVGSLGGIAFAEGNPLALIAGILGIALAVANVVIVLRLEDDFKVKRVRQLLTLDSDATTGMDYLKLGRAYAARGMWAKAALHFRRAAALMPNHVDGLMGLAQAGAKLGDLELAEWALETALDRIPSHPQAQAALETLRKRSATTEV